MKSSNLDINFLDLFKENHNNTYIWFSTDDCKNFIFLVCLYFIMAIAAFNCATDTF